MRGASLPALHPPPPPPPPPHLWRLYSSSLRRQEWKETLPSIVIITIIIIMGAIGEKGLIFLCELDSSAKKHILRLFLIYSVHTEGANIRLLSLGLQQCNRVPRLMM